MSLDGMVIVEGLLFEYLERTIQNCFGTRSSDSTHSKPVATRNLKVVILRMTALLLNPKKSYTQQLRAILRPVVQKIDLRE